MPRRVRPKASYIYQSKYLAIVLNVPLSPAQSLTLVTLYIIYIMATLYQISLSGPQIYNIVVEWPCQGQGLPYIGYDNIYIGPGVYTDHY